MEHITVQGDGVAARCLAVLLKRAGHRVSLTATHRSKVPAIMLGEAALRLIRDVFGRPNLLREGHRIHTRIVAWGGDPKSLPHSAVVVSEQALLQALTDEFEMCPEQTGESANWKVFTSRPLPERVVEHQFGHRQTQTVRVNLVPGSDPQSCWIESLESGWLFLIPDSPGTAWLLAVGAPAEVLLDASRIIAREILPDKEVHGVFPSCPRIVAPLGSQDTPNDRWLACGTAAMNFDPICGDGTAHAVREAILAAAVIDAASKETGSVAGRERIAGLLDHYSSRLTAGFERHLRLCGSFYASGYRGAWWDSELDRIKEGIVWCASQVPQLTPFRYRLNGFAIEALA